MRLLVAQALDLLPPNRLPPLVLKYRALNVKPRRKRNNECLKLIIAHFNEIGFWHVLDDT